MESRPRIVVTGIGVVTSIGIGVEEFWPSVLAGRSGISTVESFDTGRYAVHLGGEVKGFDAAKYVRRLPPGSMARASHLAIAAARLALEDAGNPTAGLDPPGVGVSMGTTSGEPAMIERFDDMEMAGSRERIGPEF